MAEIDLHVHPFLGRNGITDVVDAMNYTKLDILALESLDASLYPLILDEIKKFYPDSLYDNSGIRLPNGKYLLNAREYNTWEGIHIITVGYSLDDAAPDTNIKKIIDKGLENNALVILDHPFVDNHLTRTAGHISEKKEQEIENICKEYSGNIGIEWNGYCVPWIRLALKIGLNAIGIETRYHDVNIKAESLSLKLKNEGYNVPVIADTDLHARSRRHLYHMGTARIITDIKEESPREVVNSLRQNIMARNYENVKRYVSSFHLLEAFCIPIMVPEIFFKPRA